ncbi:MAG: phage terminase large subunit [Solirubrobacterales bacterium]
MTLTLPNSATNNLRLSLRAKAAAELLRRRKAGADDAFSQLAPFTVRQQEASDAIDAFKYTLYGGARGGGKSFLLRKKLVLLLRHWFETYGLRNVHVMLACEDFPSLRKRQIAKIEVEFPPSLGRLYMGERKEFVLAEKYGGGVIELCNLDDASKYQSAEFAAIGIDEVNKNSERTFHVLRGSLRWPGIQDTKMLFTANPDASWVRRYWVERDFPSELATEADQFVFVPALPTDNPHLDESYWQMLATLPDALREAWLEGNWFAAVEGLVYANFSDANIVDTELNITKPIEIAIDDGYVDARATLFFQKQADGSLLVFDELYETQTLEEVTIANIKAKAMQHNVMLPRVAAVSHEAVALRRRLAEAGIPAVNWMQTPVGGKGSTRLAAITLTRAMICDGQKKRNIHVHRRCKNLLDELRSGYKYPEGKRGLDTVPLDENDHAAQSLESYIWYKFGGMAARKPRVREY